MSSSDGNGCLVHFKTASKETCSAVLVEPFCGGSHKQLMEILIENIPGCAHYCLPAKKWHWRMRTSALYFADVIPHSEHFRTLFTSSVLNLAELVGLRPDLAKLKKVLYFHENQLVYPVRKQQDRDFQFGYNQIISCLVADVIVFNSKFNMESFLGNINSFLKLMPDHRPKGIHETIKPKCKVAYFPLINNISFEIPVHQKNETTGPLHIVWAHRWEHDKNPDLLFNTLFHLMDEKLDFRVSVIGQTFSEIPEIFREAKKRLGKTVMNWGFMESRIDYVDVLRAADVTVSTAKHEFFGVAMLEAVQCGCYPLCPKDLVYPEIFSDQYLYSTPGQLAKKLRYFCKNPGFVRAHTVEVDLSQFSWDNLKESYHELLMS